jgi:hypothetical protein
VGENFKSKSYISLCSYVLQVLAGLWFDLLVVSVLGTSVPRI